MKKLLLVLLTWSMFPDASQANAPMEAANETGGITVVVNKVRRVVLRLKGMWLGSLIRKGMTFEQVIEILGSPDGFDGGLAQMCCFYRELGICVDVTVKWDENISFDRVIHVRIR